MVDISNKIYCLYKFILDEAVKSPKSAFPVIPAKAGHAVNL